MTEVAEFGSRCILPPQLEREFPESLVMVENGYASLIVNGDCSYSMYGIAPSELPGVARVGRLGDDTADELARAFLYGQWEERGLLGAWPGAAGVFDAPDTVFYGPDGIVVCSSHGFKRFDQANAGGGSAARRSTVTVA